jgi:hypothetical protein
MTTTIPVDVLDAPPPRRFRLLDVQRMASKAAIACALAVLLARLVHNDDPLSAGFVALVCVAPSAYGGLKRGFEQLAASFVGALVATLFVLLLPSVRTSPLMPLVIAPAMLVSLVVCLRFLSDSAYFTAGFSSLYVFIMPFATGVDSFQERMVAVACGVMAASCTNALAVMFMGPAIVLRRRSIAREAVAEALRARSQSLVGKLDSAAATDAHHHALAVLAEASFDFGDSAREAFFPGAARTRREALAALAEARVLTEMLHVVAPLAFVEAPVPSLPRWAGVLDTLADALRYGATLRKARALADDALTAENHLVAAAQGRLLIARISACETLVQPGNDSPDLRAAS